MLRTVLAVDEGVRAAKRRGRFLLYATFPMLNGTPEELRAEVKDVAGLEVHALKPGETLG